MKNYKTSAVNKGGRSNRSRVNPKFGQHHLKRYYRKVSNGTREILLEQHSITTLEELFCAVEGGLSRSLDIPAAEWNYMLEAARKRGIKSGKRRRQVPRVHGVLGIPWMQQPVTID